MKIYILTVVSEHENLDESILGGVAVETFVYLTKESALRCGIELYLEYFNDEAEYPEEQWLPDPSTLNTRHRLGEGLLVKVLTKKFKEIQEEWEWSDPRFQVRMNISSQDVSPFFYLISKGRKIYYEMKKKRISKKLFQQKAPKG